MFDSPKSKIHTIQCEYNTPLPAPENSISYAYAYEPKINPRVTSEYHRTKTNDLGYHCGTTKHYSDWATMTTWRCYDPFYTTTTTTPYYIIWVGSLHTGYISLIPLESISGLREKWIRIRNEGSNIRAFLLEPEGMEGEISSPPNQLGTDHIRPLSFRAKYTYTTLRALLHDTSLNWFQDAALGPFTKERREEK